MLPFIIGSAWAAAPKPETVTEAAEANPAPAPTDLEQAERVMIVVFSRPGWWDQIGITYDHKVSEQQARADLRELARHAGWKPDHIRITHDPGVPGGPVMTSVEFVAQALDPRTHNLPLEPIARAFSQYRRVGATFMLPPGYPYWGPLSYQAPGVALRGDLTLGTYNFHLTITDPKLRRFEYPLKDPAQPKAAPEPKPERNPFLLRLALVVGMALAVAAFVYGIASYTKGRS
ncbi:MAG: hypothetical protein KY468_12910 [Armatimonadetes bacterium]|nr:hypothetical protein [Armatimonadota bacterium]